MKEIFKGFERLDYSLLPTMIHKLENLSKYLKSNIYCKRDDMTGFAFGGNKTRKLDYLIADALRKNADTLIAVGANQSNFCRIASGYGAVSGLNVKLVLGGKKPDRITGNLMLDYLFGADIIHVDSENWSDWENEGKELEKKLITDGKKVYYMPIGGSTEIGALGYTEAMIEINKFSTENNIYFDKIFHPTGSAGTQSGLVVGKSLTKCHSDIMGIAITKTENQIKKEVEGLSEKTGKLLNVNINYNDIIVDDNYIGECYGAETESAKESIKLFAKKEGILLDNVYSGKAAAGMIDYIRAGRILENENILFLHTGGNIQLFK